MVRRPPRSTKSSSSAASDVYKEQGYQSVIEVLKTSRLFRSNSTIYGGRYHSLKLQEPFKSATIDITMRCKKTNVAMALEDKTNHIYGFQFHPESFLTENGNIIIKKILST